VGYAPGVACESTEDRPEGVSWAFEFTVESQDDPPTDDWNSDSGETRTDEAVFIALDWDTCEEEEAEEFAPSWFGYMENGGDGFEFSEDLFFSSASEAVRWWRGRSSRIYVRLEEKGEPFWAGEEPASATDAHLRVFDEHDERAPVLGALQAAQSRRASRRALAKSERRQLMMEEGLRLQERRAAVGISVDDLAMRMGVEPGWIREVESGEVRPDPSLSTWVDLVWATTEPWPEARTSADQLWEGSESTGVVVVNRGLLRPAEELVARRIRGSGG
jgi:DNA-binding XRE family transcriptional regulator